MTKPVIFGVTPEFMARDGLTETIQPWEDGLRAETGPGSFEWWYFDAHFEDGSTVVLVFMTKPLLERNDPLNPHIAFTITRPDGSIDRPEYNQGQLVYTRTDQLGVYELDFGDGKPAFFAINLFSPLESQIDPSQSLGTGPQAIAGTAAGAQNQEEPQAQREWWRLLALIALGILTAEWLVYHRPTLRMTFQKLTSALGRQAQ